MHLCHLSWFLRNLSAKHLTQGAPELCPNQTVDEEIDGRVDDGEIASDEVDEPLCRWCEVYMAFFIAVQN